MAKVMLLVGTKKGAFLLESDEKREEWDVRGPFCESWEIMHATYDPASGTIFAAGQSGWYGAAVWRSRDLGETWSHSSQGITYGDEGPKVGKLWNVTPAHGALYVGADPAGLFRSDDGGDTFVHVAGLRNHPTQPQWEPGNGGLCLHTIVPHPTDPKQIWVAASAVGCFYTADGGETWETRNQGIRAEYFPGYEAHEVGYCVHKIVMAPGNPDVLYQQSHQGMYRSDDGGRRWQSITAGLPTDFGFPIVVHPHDPKTAYVIPLQADASRTMIGGAAAVWRTRDGGETWERMSEGLPQSGAYLTVLREAMATDTLPDAGIYFGTSTGQVFGSRDGGDSWQLIAEFLPPISGVEAAVVND